jgi:hypothetical protein
MNEVWKDIPGYEGYYQASDMGRIKSLSRLIKTKKGNRGFSKELIMSPKVDKDGYRQVSLNKDFFGKDFRVHRLVLLAFKGLPPEGKNIGMHIDDNPANNSLGNLKWGSESDNVKDAFDKGRKSAPKPWLGKSGESNPHSKKINQLDASGTVINTFVGIYEAHRQTKINRSCISACCLGNRKSSGGFRWKYAS